MKCSTCLEVSQYIAPFLSYPYNAYKIADTIWISKNGKVELDKFEVRWVWENKRKFVVVAVFTLTQRVK